ncbi:MAG TPA: hypothetical protein VLV83_17955 [Acidobacteriota bacterium]|nr:hypothetical protein [Acidobacteriota bacterium]
MSTLRTVPLCLIVAASLLLMPRSFLRAGGQELSPRGFAPPTTFFVPQFGHGTDQFGNVFSTEINFLNLSTSAASVTVATFNDSGQPVNLLRQDVAPQTPPTSVDETALEIAGSGTARQESLNLAPTTELNLGYAVITSQEPIGVEIIFTIETDQGELTSTNLKVGPTLNSASLLGRVQEGGNTGLALLNPPDNPAVTVDLTFVGTSGVTLDSAEVSLEPGEKMSQFANELFDDVPPGTFGSIHLMVEDTEAVAALPLRQDGVELTTQELFNQRSGL